MPITVLALFVAGIFSYQEYEIQSLRKEVSTLSLQLTSSTLALAKTVSAFDATLRDLGKQTSGLSSTLSYTQENIDAVRSKVGGVEQAVGSISGTVSTLQKLSQVDQMLLKKYSKVYFLNENYIPAHLTLIPKSFTYNENRDERFLTEANTFLLSLLNQSKQDGITLYVKSAYRSFDEQKSLKSQYAVTYGKGTANTFSADQGYSEHQLGTTIDFTKFLIISKIFSRYLYINANIFLGFSINPSNSSNNILNVGANTVQ
jgi:LAS superfamily LD-carboxypeptidase LdcB